MSGVWRSVAAVVAVALGCSGATLEKLTLDQMIDKSTQIVRGKITTSNAAFRGQAGRGGMIYTYYTVKVTERLKGTGQASVEVAVPGGTAQGFRQVFAGTPSLNAGEEYVFFLWTSRTGLTQVLGLTQGLLTLTAAADGKQMLSRDATSETMIDPVTGQPVTDAGVRISLNDLRQRIAKTRVE